MPTVRSRNTGILASMLLLALVLGGTGILPVAACAAPDTVTITLPPPQKNGGMPLMEALNQRKTVRQFSAEPIGQQVLGDLLWATFGVTRPDGRRTAPTARNQQKILLYVALADGIWRYEGDHSLTRVVAGDMRSKMGTGELMLIYAVPAADDRWADMHVGSLYQNAGLFCASAGLGNVVRAQGVPPLEKVLPLPQGYSVRMVQAVGWPK